VDGRRFRWVLVAFAGLLAVTWWRPPFPAEQAMHHSLTIIGLVALILVHRRWRLPFSSYALILVFLGLHSVAARWMYSFVPYDDWTRALFGVSLSEAAGWERNHFDRLVHLAYGLCFGPVILGLLRGRWAPLLAVEVILSTSALYELFEWGIALTLAPTDAESYNGQQGDMWDAHKDMALATAGAVLSVLVTWWWRRRADLAPVCSDGWGSKSGET
jgi:putative membrane protein